MKYYACDTVRLEKEVRSACAAEAALEEALA